MQVSIYIPVICKQVTQIGLSSKSKTCVVPQISQCVQLTISEVNMMSSISSIDMSSSLHACHSGLRVLLKHLTSRLYLGSVIGLVTIIQVWMSFLEF